LIKLKISLEQRVNELQSRLDEVDHNSIKDGKRTIKALEQKVIYTMQYNILLGLLKHSVWIQKRYIWKHWLSIVKI